MRVDTERKLFICPYCGAQEPFDATSKEEIQELLRDALNDANKESKQMMEKMIASHRREMEDARQDSTLKNVAFYVAATVAACFTFIMAMFGLTTEYKASGVVALIQFILLLAAITLKATSGKERDRRKSKSSNVCMIAAALLVIVWIVALTVPSESSNKKTYMDEIYAQEYDWPDEGYAKVVPRWGEHPDYAYAGDREFRATILNATQQIFNDYVAKCKEEGFNIDVTESDDTFNAYNEAGNELDLHYLSNSDNRELYVTMLPALEFLEMTWPKQGVLKDVPQPDSNEIMIESMSTDFFKAYVNNITPDKYAAYIQECMEAGFEGRYEGGSAKFYGSKGDVSLSLELKRNRVLLLTVY